MSATLNVIVMCALWCIFMLQCYTRLHDKPLTASSEDTEAGSSELSVKELRKLRNKERKREKKAQENKKGINSLFLWF